jgi:PhoPQ-activated pathogenicity-related protein
MKRLRIFMMFVILALSAGGHAGDLLSYVQAPDDSFKWERVSRSDVITGDAYVLKMTSQTWQGIPWTHEIEFIKPAKPDYPKTAILLITFGKAGGEQTIAMAALAAATGCPVAVLYGIPNQPLFDGLDEDALIAHTFVKTLETGDDTWPLLFPMTKAAIRAMDAVQAFSRSEFKEEITGFVVSGASKRGWTTWLTAAADPERVKAIVPIVYDNLNLTAQMPHQIECYGVYSAQIHDYTDRGVQKALQTDEGKHLASIVDPWLYRDRITMPRLIINGTNDPYWTQDALNLYWDTLKGRKYVMYIPNAGHDMSGSGVDGVAKMVITSGAFVRAIAAGRALPDVTWKYAPCKDGRVLDICVDPTNAKARLWTAKSDTLDFRKSTWKSSPMGATKSGFTDTVPIPDKGYAAVLGEVSMPLGDRVWTISTQIQILDSKESGPSSR